MHATWTWLNKRNLHKTWLSRDTIEGRLLDSLAMGIGSIVVQCRTMINSLATASKELNFHILFPGSSFLSLQLSWKLKMTSQHHFCRISNDAEKGLSSVSTTARDMFLLWKMNDKLCFAHADSRKEEKKQTNTNLLFP